LKSPRAGNRSQYTIEIFVAELDGFYLVLKVGALEFSNIPVIIDKSPPGEVKMTINMAFLLQRP
jgi:hypothetical protein